MHPIVDFAQNILGIKLYPGQAVALSEFYTSNKPNWLLLAGRRSGKSMIAKIICAYEAIQDYSEYLRPGEFRYILLVSNREENCKPIIRDLSGMIGRRLKNEFIATSDSQIILRNNTIILALPASARAARSWAASTLVMDEAAFFIDGQGNSSAEAVFQALSPTVAQFGDKGKIILTTSVNSRSGLVYDLFSKAEAGEVDDWHVTRVDTRSMNPKISEKVIQNALKRDSESAQAEYFSEFREPIEAFLPSEAIYRAVDQTLTDATPAKPGVIYMAAIDPATMGDRYGFIVAHIVEGIVMVDYVSLMKPPVDLQTAELLIHQLAEHYRPVAIRCDTASTALRLKSEIPALEYTPFSRPFKLKIYGSLKELLNAGRLVLPNHKPLIEELQALQIRNGVDISAPHAGPVKHDDLADCLALVVEALVSQSYQAVTILPDPYEDPEGFREYCNPTKVIEGPFTSGKFPSFEALEMQRAFYAHQAQEQEDKRRAIANNFWNRVDKEMRSQ